MARKYDIGPKIGIDGEKEFRDAINKSYTALRTLGTEMQVATSKFDKNDKSQENLTAQNKVLNKQIAQQEALLTNLNKVLKYSKDELGENHEATEKWQQSVNRQTAKLNNLKNQVKSNNAAMADGAMEALGLKKSIDKVGDSADKNGGKLKTFGKIAGSVGKVALKTMAGIKTAAVAAAKGILNLVENTKEYRSDMSKLEQNAKNANQDFDVMKDHVQGLTSLTGEMDSSIEAVSNLMATGFDENGITQAVDALSGAVIKFPDTLKIEGLADGLQETLATGKAVGPFAELIERMGGSLEEFDEQMAGATTQAEKQQVALKWLADSGLSEVNEAYRENNKEMLNAAEAQLKLDDSMASLATTFEPTVATIKGGVAEVLDSLIGMATGVEGSTEDFKTNIDNLVQGVLEQIDSLIPMVVATAEALIPALIEGIVGSLPQLIEAAIIVLDTLITTIINNLPLIIQAAIKLVNMLLSGIIKSLPLIISGATQIIISLALGLAKAMPTLIPSVVEMVLTIVEGLINNMPLLIDAALQLVTGIAEGLIDAHHLLAEQAPELVKALVEGIVTAIPLLIDTAIELVMSFIDYLLEGDNLSLIINAAIEIMFALIDGLIRAIPEIVLAIPKIIASIINTFMETDWAQVGIDIISGIGEGILNAGSNLWETVKTAALNIYDGFKNALQIESPSKLMKNDVGKMIGFGVAEGIEDSQREVEEAFGALTKELNLNSDYDSTTTHHNDYSSNDNSRHSQVNLYVNKDDDDLEYERQTNEMLRRVGTVMA